MAKYTDLATNIVEKVGGKENVSSIFHCVTRLRFKLKDESIAKTEEIKKMDGVVTVMKSGGQYQVVIGTHVPEVFSEVVKVGGFATDSNMDTSDADNAPKGSLFDRFIDMISAIFTPTLGVLSATGMIKGFVALFVALGWLDMTSGTYTILQATGDALFYSLPVFLGYTASKKFKGNPFIGMTIGFALIYPSISALMGPDVPTLYTLFEGTVLASPVKVTFLGIPVIMMSYASSVIPIICSIFVSAKVERFFAKVIPSVVRNFLVPFCTLLVMVPLTFLVIGPLATWAGMLLGAATQFVYNLSPIIAGILLGGFWQVFVIFGLHWGLVPIAMNNIANGGDTILALTLAASFAQIGAVLAVWIKTKNMKLKSLAIPAFISGIFGVTEPAIYGVTLPLKRPFYASCAAAAVGGGILGFFNTTGYIMGGLGIFAFPSYISPDGINSGFIGAVVASIVGIVLGFVFTYVAGFKDEDLV
ncbi:PTS transporter subunit EIIC [Carnobacterium gallinarum]|uniref:PTS transporter subunit EIIC n=1 Tax=Carnobacterium gallinarum TaxID=2749 RepID=UPI000689B50E|nr:PTS transporter subunit EIIC [Carnobacterium gallinarum]